MDTIARALVMYAVLLVIFRANGKRTLAQITTFDFVLLLILGEVTQQALTGDDYSITTAVILILTLIGVDTTLTLLQRRSRWLDRLLEGTPLVLVDDGAPLERPDAPLAGGDRRHPGRRAREAGARTARADQVRRPGEQRLDLDHPTAVRCRWAGRRRPRRAVRP